MSNKYPGIPDPAPNIASLHNVVMPMKETIEVLTGQRGDRLTSGVTWGDLVDLGLVRKDQVPK